jgi:hypothetical protein
MALPVLDGARAEVRLLAWSQTALRFRHLANITILALAFFGVLKASPHQLDTISYNFGLAGGGGGSAAKLDKTMNIEIFCVDFANEIIVPQNNYSANLTSLTSGGFTPATTRFGSNTSWRTVREILSPGSYLAPPLSANPSAALEQAAVWYSTTSGAARDSYLANYRIVSDSTMTACGPVLCGGFQEQITVVPEPKYIGLLLMGLFALFSIHLRKASTRTQA